MNFLEQMKLNFYEMRAFILLLAGSVLGSIGIVPYLTEITPEAIENIPLAALIFNGVFNSAVAIYIGILAKRNLPLAGAPYLERRYPLPVKNLLWVCGVTAVIALSLLLSTDLLFRNLMPEVMKELTQVTPSAMSGFFASFYGGINEEILLRFFLMTILVRLFLRLGESRGIWLSIFLVALIFGIGHLPTVVSALDLNSIFEIPGLLVVRILLLNAVVGVITGYLYWKKGIEYAIFHHFLVDILLHVVVRSLN